MNYTSGKIFLDTNFLLYCFSRDEAEKRQCCLSILQQGRESAIFVLSTQVVKEFSAVMLKKFQMDPLNVKQIISDFVGFEIVQVDLPIIQQGLDLHLIHKLSFWDSLIVAAAQAANCQYLLSEDMQHTQKIGSLQVWNPFLPTP